MSRCRDSRKASRSSPSRSVIPHQGSSTSAQLGPNQATPIGKTAVDFVVRAVQNTYKRSASRITRETELLGGEYSSYHSRENLVIGAKFLREDLPYFAELIGEVVSMTKYTGTATLKACSNTEYTER